MFWKYSVVTKQDIAYVPKITGFVSYKLVFRQKSHLKVVYRLLSHALSVLLPLKTKCSLLFFDPILGINSLTCG